MSKQIYSYKIKQKDYLAKNIIGLKLIPKDNDKIFDFKSGQFVMLGLYDKNGNIWKKIAFSICSSPLNKEYIQLGIKIYGEFTKAVDNLKQGDIVEISGPYGVFTFNEGEMNNVVFVAGGIGITPFMSAIRYVFNKGLDNKITLIYSNRAKQDIVFYKELKNIAEKNKNFKLIFALTQKIPFLWKGEKCRIDNKIFKKYCLPINKKYFLLCGPPGFIKAMHSCLLNIGVGEDFIKAEKW